MDILKGIDLTEGFYCLYKSDLFIKSKIKKVTELVGGGLSIKFYNGELQIHEKSIIEKKEPSGAFCWYFTIKNTHGEIIGSIGKPKER